MYVITWYRDIIIIMHGTASYQFFDIIKPTCMCTDASRQGLGFVLQQQSTAGEWTLVQTGSCFLPSAESKYVWAILKCKLFLAELQHFKIIQSTHANPE